MCTSEYKLLFKKTDRGNRKSINFVSEKNTYIGLILSEMTLVTYQRTNFLAILGELLIWMTLLNIF